MRICHVCTRQHQHVGIGNLFLLVCQFQEFLVYLIEFRLIVNIHAIHVQTIFQRCPTRTCGQYDRVIVQPNILGVDNLVCMYVFQHAILMNATGMGESISSHDSLIGLYGHVHQTANHPTDGIDFIGIDIGVDS